MRRTFPAILLINLLTALPAWAVDYDKIDRVIRKEPAYSGKPEYALLLFGPEARRRVWVVVDGELAYVDRNGDGDLTAPEEKFALTGNWQEVEVSDPVGTTRYTITSLRVHRDGADPPFVMANVDVHGGLEYQQYCDARLGATTRDAAIAHFHGPLAIGPRTISWKVPPETELRTGNKVHDIYAMIGTMSERHHCWVVVVSHKAKECCFAEGVRPRVAVEFPSKDRGKPPIIESYGLDEFC